MSNAYGKPKSVKLTARDEAALEAANEAFDWVREAELLRIAIRVGLESLSKDPTPLGKPPIKPEMFKVLRRSPDETEHCPPPTPPSVEQASVASDHAHVVESGERHLVDAEDLDADVTMAPRPASDLRPKQQNRAGKRDLDRLDSTGKKPKPKR